MITQKDVAEKAGVYSGISTVELRKNIKTAREIQFSRQNKLNSKLTPEEIPFYCALSKDLELALAKYAEKYDFSARGIHSCIKLARTIADMQGTSHQAVSKRWRRIKKFFKKF